MPHRNDAVVPQADDGGDHADLELRKLKPASLFDMRLEISAVAGRLHRQSRTPRITSLAERIAHHFAMRTIARPIDLVFADVANEGAAAEITAVMPLLVAERDHVDAKIARRWIVAQSPRGFEREDHAECAVEPSGVVLGFDM